MATITIELPDKYLPTLAASLSSWPLTTPPVAEGDVAQVLAARALLTIRRDLVRGKYVELAADPGWDAKSDVQKKSDREAAATAAKTEFDSDATVEVK